MANTIKSLTEIFNNKQFRIPDFQRGYSWQVAQLEDFWQDLENLEPEYIHYTGVLTIDLIDKESPLWEITKRQNPRLLENSGYRLFSVIDGQQRLTTSIILISVILKSFDRCKLLLDERIEAWEAKFLFKSYEKSEPCYIFGYDQDPSSFEFLKTKIFGQNSKESDNVKLKTVYTKNLGFAMDFFNKKLVGKSEGEISAIFKKLVQQFKFNEFEIGRDLDIHVTFETMNNRGKPLSNLELLKNRLIYVSSKLKESDQDKADLRAEIHSCWRTIYNFLGAEEDVVLDDDRFLTVHRNVFFPFDRSNKVPAKEYLLNQTFTVLRVHSGDITLDFVRKYISSLRESAKYWHGINFPEKSDFPGSVVEWLEKIGRLDFRNLGPVLLASAFQYNKGKCSEAEFRGIAKAVERYNFLVFHVSQARSNAGRSDCLDYANKIYSDSDRATVLEVSQELTDSIFNIEYGWLDLGKFEDSMADRFKKGKGYYSWSGLTYFLFEYENHLRTTDDAKIDWNKVKGNAEKSIEHIYPQTPELKCWVKAFSSVKKKHRSNLSHDLGNLVLISKSKNSQIKNYCFDHKKKHKNSKGIERGFFKGSHSEIEVNSYDHWTPHEIKTRGLKMLNFLLTNWEIDQSHLEYVTGEAIENLLYSNTDGLLKS